MQRLTKKLWEGRVFRRGGGGWWWFQGAARRVFGKIVRGGWLWRATRTRKSAPLVGNEALTSSHLACIL